MRIALALAALLSAAPALAQDEEEPATGHRFVYRSVTTLDIEDGIDIDAEALKPSGSFLFDRKRAAFKPMIQLRRDFADALEGSVDEVR
jgi:hypothetical protein